MRPQENRYNLDSNARKNLMTASSFLDISRQVLEQSKQAAESCKAHNVADGYSGETPTLPRKIKQNQRSDSIGSYNIINSETHKIMKQSVHIDTQVSHRLSNK